MKKLASIFIVIILFGCQGNGTNEQTTSDQASSQAIKDTSLIEILIQKFGEPNVSERNADIYMVYSWESYEEEIGRKFKNEIDKKLNVLPYSTDTQLDTKSEPPSITDVNRWETPRIFVELTHSFKGIDNKILSNITVKINNK